MLRKNEVWDMIAWAMNGVKKVSYFSGGVCQKSAATWKFVIRRKKIRRGKRDGRASLAIF